MGNKINSLIMVVLAVVVFFTGAGVTIMNYCCSNCRTDALFVAEHPCCSSQDKIENSINLSSCCSAQTNSVESSCADNSIEKEDNHCYTKRISVDIDSSISRIQLAAPFAWISDMTYMSQCILLQGNESANDDLNLIGRPPLIAPRSYLSIISVLII